MNTAAPPPLVSGPLIAVPPPLRQYSTPFQKSPPVVADIRSSWQAQQRPIAGCFLLFCAIAQALYALKMPPEGMPPWAMMLCIVVPLAAASISSLTGDLRPLWLVTGSLLAGLGVFLISTYSLPNACKIQQAQTWPKTGCTVVFSAVLNHAPVIRYEYAVGDRVYKSEVIDFLVAPGNVDRAPEAFVAQYPSNHVAACFFNPNNPAEATLERAWRPAHLHALLPLAFLFFGLGLLVATLRKCLAGR